MRKYLVSLLALLAFPAMGADYPQKPYVPHYSTAYNWSGTYVGIGVGHTADSVVNVPGVVGMENDSWFVSGFVGFNAHYANNLVLGVEADLGYSDQNGSAFGGLLTQKTNFTGTLRGRVGYAMDRWLVYGTGGLALANSEATIVPLGLTDTNLHVGWVAGAGIEYAMTKNMILRGQWLYHDLGSKNYFGLAEADLTWQSWMLGAAYKF